MASWIFRASKAITNYTKNVNIISNGTAVGLLLPKTLLLQNTRNSSFFNRKSADHLWKSVITVSNAGKKRGRGKGAPKVKNLNAGQKLGVGKIPMIFPGLSVNIRERYGVNPVPLRSTEIETEALATSEKKDPISKKRRRSIHPLLRGWSGGHVGGRKLGPPDPIEDDTFEGFESWVLQCNKISVMTGALGRVKRFRSTVITGNRNGLVGFSNVLGANMKSCLNTAKNRAGQRVFYIERYNNHTVLHDFFTQFGHTKIFVKQKPKGYGLKCHRVIKTCCEAIGITDLYAKVEGSTNVPYIMKAFLIGLLKQKTPQEMANEKKLHLVEMRKEKNYFPTVLASPPVVRKAEEIPQNEILDFNQYIMDGRIPLKKKKARPFFEKLPSWNIHLRKQEHHRGQFDVIVRLNAKYNDHCSFLAEKYPEARGFQCTQDNKEEEESTS